MGMSADGLLVYGYNLGGVEDQWLIKGLGEYDPLDVPWWDREADEETGEGFAEAVERVLLAAAGFTETDTDAPGYYERRRAADQALKVFVASYCTYDYAGYFLARFSNRASASRPLPVDFRALEERRIAEHWDEHLYEALGTLALDPVQLGPQWFVASLYG